MSNVVDLYDDDQQPAATAAPSTNRRRRAGRTTSKSTTPTSSHPTYQSHMIPAEITSNTKLQQSIRSTLPSNYNFEVEKTIWRILSNDYKSVGLQLPEGLLMYACVIADILQEYTHCECIILSDVTYGACCVEDLTAEALGCDLLVHYGHSCLVPNSETNIPTLYVFVTIGIDNDHLYETIVANFPKYSGDEHSRQIYLGSTIQFINSLQHVAPRLQEHYQQQIQIPQCRPLSQGEVLGCTAPTLSLPSKSASANHADSQQDDSYNPLVVFVSDGRFHLESMMIANPDITHFCKYDPYQKSLTREQYGHTEMQTLRQDAIARSKSCKHFGLVLGTLGRQGSVKLLSHMQQLLTERNRSYTVILLSELSPAKVAMMSQEIDCYIQIACPRLSIDWGHYFSVPLLNTYEAEVMLGSTDWQQIYPQDYYAKDGGSWTNYAHKQKPSRGLKANRAARPAQKQPTVAIEYEGASVTEVYGSD